MIIRDIRIICKLTRTDTETKRGTEVATNNQAMPILLLNLRLRVVRVSLQIIRSTEIRIIVRSANLSNNKFLVSYGSLGVLALRDR